MSDWIKCSEQMPKAGKPVIICYYGSDLIIAKNGESLENTMERITKHATVWIGTYYNGEEKGWYGADGFPLMVTPTYWQDLPEPPECPAELIEQAKEHGKILAEKWDDIVNDESEEE